MDQHKPLDNARDEWRVFTDNMTGKIIPVILEGKRELALERLQTIQKHRYDRFVANLDSLITSLDRLSDQAEQSVESMVQKRMLAMIYISLIIVLIIVVLVLIVTLEFKTEKERAEQYLRIAEVVLAAFDDKGRITLLNRKGHEVLGYEDGELLGKEWLRVCVPAEEHGQVSSLFHKMLSGESEQSEYFEHNVVKKNGERRIIAWHNTVMKDTNGRVTGILSSGEDITERTRAEVERVKTQVALNQAQKMDSVGRLAGGIAHDFNNKLTVILGYAQLSEMLECPNNRQCGDNTREIIRAGLHAQEITRKLLAFSRSDEVTPLKLNLNFILDETRKTLGRMIGEHISLHVELQNDLWSVRIDPTQFDQVVTNLVVNARDAMPRGGVITLRTANVAMDDRHDLVPEGDYVLVTCSDTGCGMDAKTLQHVFEPFFTTKEVGKGTGLGLSSVYGIVKQNHGYVTAHSVPDAGAVFSVYLPRIADSATYALSETVTMELNESGTVLLVEDEEPVRKITQLMLETIGYRVIAADSPEHAVELCKDPRNDFDCVVSDVIMPGMNGRVLKGHINAIRPDLPLVFMSGYPADVIRKKLESDEEMHYIRKPLDFRLLNQSISQLMRDTIDRHNREIPCQKKSVTTR